MDTLKTTEKEELAGLTAVWDSAVLWRSSQDKQDTVRIREAIEADREALKSLPEAVQNHTEARRDLLQESLRALDESPPHPWKDRHLDSILRALRTLPDDRWDSGKPAVLAVPGPLLNVLEGAGLELPRRGLHLRYWDRLGDDTIAVLRGDQYTSLLLRLAPGDIPENQIDIYARLREDRWNPEAAADICRALW